MGGPGGGKGLQNGEKGSAPGHLQDEESPLPWKTRSVTLSEGVHFTNSSFLL